MCEKKSVLFTLLCVLTACTTGKPAAETKQQRPPTESTAGHSATATPTETSPLPTVTTTDIVDPALNVDVQSSQGIVVDVVKVSCAGACVDVIAVARGGNPPYAYSWEDGSTQAARRLCPDADSVYNVTVTDTEIAADEFKHDMLTAETQVQAQVLDCSDTADACSVASLPGSGTYTGGLRCAPGEQVELPTADGGSQLAFLTLNLMTDPNQAEQSGSFVFSWVVGGLIAIDATFTGILDCDTGALHATFHGIWGWPVNGVLVESGKVWGDLTAVGVPGAPGMISGVLNCMSSGPGSGGPDAGAPYPTVEIPGVMTYQGGKCTGTYEASLEP
jgi:hypothetical protein